MHRVLQERDIEQYESAVGREAIKCAVERELDRARVLGGAGDVLTAVVSRVRERLDALCAERLVCVINATGIVVHTNLGRAPLAGDSLDFAASIAAGYSNLEFDLASGERGSRYGRVRELLRERTGAQDALVVNNCAAAVLLVLDTFARGREVVVARGQLVEVGGGLRMPDVLARSGATLVEVGTTNKVYIADYERALSPRSALLLRAHPSNYSIEGFTHEVDAAALAALGARAGVPVVEDLGSGALVDLTEYGLPHERTVSDAVGDGVALVAFSGDKLLGGPQAGVLVGRAQLIARLRSNPLLRALRTDKVTLALLAHTLELHRTAESRARIPLYRMLGTTLQELRDRAQRYERAVPGVRTVEHVSRVGGGALPRATLASLAMAIDGRRPDAIAAALRRNDPPVIARVEGGAVLLDLRTIAPDEDADVIAALVSNPVRASFTR